MCLFRFILLLEHLFQPAEDEDVREHHREEDEDVQDRHREEDEDVQAASVYSLGFIGTLRTFKKIKCFLQSRFFF